MKTIGSQKRERLAESGMVVLGKPCDGTVTLFNPRQGTAELWYVNDHHAGYTIQIGRWGYEFGQSLDKTKTRELMTDFDWLQYAEALLGDECGQCSAYHLPDFHGDCRNDLERFESHQNYLERVLGIPSKE